jgi:hypothetical protein
MLAFSGVRTRGVLALAVLLLVSGCPLTDDYFVNSTDVGSVSGASGDSSGSGGASGAGRGSVGGSAGAGIEAGAGGGCDDCMPACTQALRGERPYLFCSSTTYELAAEVCREGSMTLAIIDDGPENDWVHKVLQEKFGLQSWAFLGGSDTAKEGEWRWIDGRAFWHGASDGEPREKAYVHWFVGQPSTFGPVTIGEEDCLTMSSSDGTWYDLGCTLEWPFVCEKQ